MRIVLLLLAAVALPASPALAQGVKDPPNYGKFTAPQMQTIATPGRPTAVRNIPTAALPPGARVQRVYRDGKMITIIQ